MTILDESLSLETIGTEEFRGTADPRYEANSGMFGGWTAALLMKAVLENPESQGLPSAITINFLRRTPPGSTLNIRTQLIGSSRSLAHWRSDLRVDGSDDLAATATIVLTNRSESDRLTQAVMPEAATPEAFPRTHLDLKFGERTDFRYAQGLPFFDQPTTRSLIWERELSGRPLDAVQLAYLCDIGAPRIFYISEGPRLSATITLSLYIHATAQELAACGDDFILSDMIATRIENSTVGSRSDLWSRDGKLLATTEQLCWFK